MKHYKLFTNFRICSRLKCKTDLLEKNNLNTNLFMLLFKLGGERLL